MLGSPLRGTPKRGPAMRSIANLTVLIFSLSFAGAALAGGDMQGKAPGDKMQQLRPGMLRMPSPSPWVKVQFNSVWLQDAHSNKTMPNASGVLSGPQICPVSLAYRATILSTTPNVTAALVLSDGTTVAANLPPAGTPVSGNYTFVFGGSVDVTHDAPNAPGSGLNVPLKTIQAHLQILSPKTLDPASTPSSSVVTMSGAQCTNVVCSVDGCGFAQ